MLRSYLEKVDLFPTLPSLNISGKSSISTFGGLFTTVIIYILSISILVYNFVEIYTVNSPIFSIQEDYRDFKEFENITIDNLNFAFGIYGIKTGKNTDRSDDRFTKLTLSPNNYLMNTKETNIIQRKALLFPQNLIKIVNSGNLTNGCDLSTKNQFFDNVFCLNFHKNLSNIDQLKYDKEKYNYFDNLFDNKDGIVQFGGSLIEAGYSIDTLLSLGISPCDLIDDFRGLKEKSDLIDFNTNASIEIRKAIETIKDQKELMLTLKSINKKCFDNYRNSKYEPVNFFSLGYENDFPDPYNKLFGYKRNIKADYIEYKPDEERINVKVILIKQVMRTDFGLIYSFGEKKINTFYRKEVKIEKALLERNLNQFEIQIQFELSDKVYIIDRSYNKIDSVLASTFSIIELFMICGKVITYFFNKHSIEYEIINNLYYHSKESHLDYKNNNQIFKTVNTKIEPIQFDLNNRINKKSQSIKLESEIVTSKKSTEEVSNNKNDKIYKSDLYNEIDPKKHNLCCTSSSNNSPIPIFRINSIPKIEYPKDFSYMSEPETNKEIIEPEKNFELMKMEAINIYKSASKLNNIIPPGSLDFFYFKPGLKDFIYQNIYCCLPTNKKKMLNLKIKQVELVNKEIDLQIMISKLYFVETLQKKQDFENQNKYSTSHRNILHLDEDLSRMNSIINKFHYYHDKVNN